MAHEAATPTVRFCDNARRTGHRGAGRTRRSTVIVAIAGVLAVICLTLALVGL
jgi:hypothetical protein